MERKVGTISRGIRCPIIRKDDDLASIVVKSVLEAAESGAGLYFVFMKESEKILQETYYTEYYSACFDDWKDRFVSMYNEYNNKMFGWYGS